MNLEFDDGEIWLDELEKFFSHWESETQTLKDRTIDPEECNNISAIFHKDSDWLMIRRPVGISDEEIFTRIEQLDGKLGSVLAMACTSELKTTKKF